MADSLKTILFWTHFHENFFIYFYVKNRFQKLVKVFQKHHAYISHSLSSVYAKLTRGKRLYVLFVSLERLIKIVRAVLHLIKIVRAVFEKIVILSFILWQLNPNSELLKNGGGKSPVQSMSTCNISLYFLMKAYFTFTEHLSRCSKQLV